MVHEYSQKKTDYYKKMTAYLGQYKRLIFCEVDNVQSQQMHNIRRGLRGKADVLLGKKTFMRRVIYKRAEAAGWQGVENALYQATCIDRRAPLLEISASSSRTPTLARSLM